MKCLLTCPICGIEKIIDFNKDTFDESKEVYERPDVKNVLKHQCEGEWNLTEYESPSTKSSGENKQNSI